MSPYTLDRATCNYFSVGQVSLRLVWLYREYDEPLVKSAWESQEYFSKNLIVSFGAFSPSEGPSSQTFRNYTLACRMDRGAASCRAGSGWPRQTFMKRKYSIRAPPTQRQARASPSAPPAPFSVNTSPSALPEWPRI